MGKACALAWILFVVVIAISVVLFWTAKHWVYYAGGDATTSKASGEEPAPGESEPAAPTPTEPAVPAAVPSAIQQATAIGSEPPAVLAVTRRRPARRRSKLNRFVRKLTSRTAFTVVTAVLCGMFLLPFLYALFGALGTPGGGSARGAPIYPAIARTYNCTDSQLCTFRPIARDPDTGKTVANGQPVDASQLDDPTIPVYAVPGYGNLALLDDRSAYDQPSVFIDPAANKQVDVVVDPSKLSRVWDFHIALDNFVTAVDWAGVFTRSGLGGMATWLVTSRSSPSSPPSERSYRACWSPTGSLGSGSGAAASCS